jgi:predicted nucleic acid-binding protein
MPRKFIDTSALVKLYVAEPESPAVQAEIIIANEVLLSRWTIVEFRSAIYGLVRQNRFSQADAAHGLSQFDADLPNFGVLPVNEVTLQRAEALLDLHAITDGLRSLDAVQLAVALEEHGVRPIDAVVTTDQIMRRVALASGMVVAP